MSHNPHETPLLSPTSLNCCCCCVLLKPIAVHFWFWLYSWLTDNKEGESNAINLNQYNKRYCCSIWPIDCNYISFGQQIGFDALYRPIYINLYFILLLLMHCSLGWCCNSMQFQRNNPANRRNGLIGHTDRQHGKRCKTENQIPKTQHSIFKGLDHWAHYMGWVRCPTVSAVVSAFIGVCSLTSDFYLLPHWDTGFVRLFYVCVSFSNFISFVIQSINSSTALSLHKPINRWNKHFLHKKHINSQLNAIDK